MRWVEQQPIDGPRPRRPGPRVEVRHQRAGRGTRDVFLEEVKDSAMAIYSRDVAVRVVERTAAIGDFAALTAPRARSWRVSTISTTW